MSNHVIAIVGPTGSGKTQLAMQMADSLNGYIISVDSVMIYKGLDIGSAKPSQDVLDKYPHALVNIRQPWERYSAADFAVDANNEINKALSMGKKPMLVGGTMLYFDALIHGIHPLPPSDEKVREEIEQEAQQKGWGSMHQQLAEVDPESAEKIHPNDPQRLTRALEIFRITGQARSALYQNQRPKSEYSFDLIGLNPGREIIRERVAHRFDEMLAQGLVEEVRELLAHESVCTNAPSLRSVGYRQVVSYVTAQLTYDEMREKAVTATRQYAKRQMTWLQKWEAIRWYETVDEVMNVWGG